MMLSAIKCITYDVSEANFVSALVNLLAASLAVSALLNNEWVIVEDDDESRNITSLAVFSGDECLRIGTRDFWRPARFGGFIGSDGHSHVVFHSAGRVLIDCVSPMVANFFYVLIALCFVIVITSSIACLLHVLAPPHGFLTWIRRNTILEMCNMMLTLTACITAILAESEVASLRPNSSVSVGVGLFLVSFSGLLSFLAALLSLRHSAKLQRARRLDNQRLLCARSLRSWRDLGRRPEDMTPIVDFERYLDSSCQMHEMSGASSEVPTTQSS